MRWGRPGCVRGETVAIFGVGGLGISAMQLASEPGARQIFAVDLNPRKLELAERFKAFRSTPQPVIPSNKFTNSQTAVESTSHSNWSALPLTMRQAVQSLAILGRAVLVGLTQKSFGDRAVSRIARQRSGDHRCFRPSGGCEAEALEHESLAAGPPVATSRAHAAAAAVHPAAAALDPGTAPGDRADDGAEPVPRTRGRDGAARGAVRGPERQHVRQRADSAKSATRHRRRRPHQQRQRRRARRRRRRRVRHHRARRLGERHRARRLRRHPRAAHLGQRPVGRQRRRLRAPEPRRRRRQPARTTCARS